MRWATPPTLEWTEQEWLRRLGRGSGVKEGRSSAPTRIVSPKYSSHQQYALALEKTIATLPSTISTLKIASIPLALVTLAFAFCLPDPAVPSMNEAVGGESISFLNGKAGAGLKPFLEEGAKGMKAGEPIIILGGSSSVGRLEQPN
ncbi:hypothetical protein PM082_012222 [Marasmius tenuissimus]|nr:hypothetical protein PM082_012222 [Marasmius tenuissimus]